MPVLALVFLLLFAGAASASARSVTYQATPAHDGHVADPALVPPLALRWERRLSGEVSYPLVADGRVFVTTSTPGGGYGSTLHALSMDDGRILWQRALGGVYYRVGIAYEAGRVFAVDFDGMVRALDAVTGAELWVRSLGKHFSSSPPTAANGIVYVESDGIFALRASDGHLLWSTSAGSGGGQSSPAYDGTRVFVSGTAPQVDAFNATTGQPVWHYDEGTSGGGGRTPVVYGGRLYTRGNFGGKVFDAATGRLVGGLDATTAPAAAAGTIVYGAQGRLWAEDTSTRTPLWNRAGDAWFSSAPLIVNGRVYAATGAGSLYAFDPRTGQQLWACATGRAINGPDEHNYSAPLAGIGAGGGLLVVPYSGGVMAFGSASASTCAVPPPGDPPGSGLPTGGSGGSRTNRSAPVPAVDYGGGIAPRMRRSGLVLSLRRDGSRLTARVGLVVTCRRVNFPQLIARGSGTITGSSFRARFTSKVVRGLRLRTTLRGTFAGDGATGTLAIKPIRGRGGPRGCRGVPRRRIVLRTAASPAGDAARPAPRAVFRGLTTQDAGGVHLPVMLSVSRDGRRLVAQWLALADCGRFNASVDNFTPRTRIRVDGSFSRPERYAIRYNDGTIDRFRISFSGRFLTDGAVGRLRARVNTVTRSGRVLARCDSGAHTFAAVSPR
jgi:outer membrane protein assembly factor BamB